MDERESKSNVMKAVHPSPAGEQHASGPPPSRSTRHQPARVERIFNLAQIFFFALTYLSSWETVALNLQAAIVNGGPRALAWGVLIVVSGALAQSASLAEMASAQPIAGAQYHWTHAFAPERHRRFITWMQGVITCFAWTSTLAGVANTTAYTLQSLAAANYPDYEAERWHVTLIIFALLVVGGLLNVYAWRLIPWIETLAGILHVLLFIIFTVVLASLAPKHNADFVFLTPASFSGWNNRFVSFNLGLMTPSWGFVGFDGAVHLSEEVRKARSAVPSAIFWTVALNGILAYAFALTVLFCLGDLEAAVNAPFPIIEVCMQATGSKRAATAMVSGLLVISFAVTLSSIASASRLTWAWARDSGLPAWFSYVSPRHRVPTRAICLPILVVMCLACLNIGSSTAFSAFISLASLALFSSYAIAIGCMLYARRTREIEGRRWSLGVYGAPINGFALVYTAWMMVIFCFPQYLPVTAVNFNYALPIFAAIVLGAMTFWFARAKTSWSGLDKEMIKRVLEDADVELSQ